MPGWRNNVGGQLGPDLVGYVQGQRVELDVAFPPGPVVLTTESPACAHFAQPMRKRCLSCGRLQNEDGTLDCGH